MDPSFFCQSTYKCKCYSSIPNYPCSCNSTFINSNYYQRVVTGTYSSINYNSICPCSNNFYSFFFKFISTADVIQVPNMHLIAPKITPMVPATIGFLFSIPFAPSHYNTIALEPPVPSHWNAIALKPPTPSHFFYVIFHLFIFAFSFVSLEVNAGKSKIYCCHCNVCCYLLYWGGKTT